VKVFDSGINPKLVGYATSHVNFGHESAGLPVGSEFLDSLLHIKVDTLVYPKMLRRSTELWGSN